MEPSNQSTFVDKNVYGDSQTVVDPNIYADSLKHVAHKGDMLLDGRYEVLDVLTKGGMGIVYKCRKKIGEGTWKTVALKTVLSGGQTSQADADQIVANFNLVHELRHPNILGVNTLEFDKATGQRYVEMDWVEGEDLETHFNQFGGDRLVVAHEVLRILKAVAVALDYAHYQGVIHRDVKDANIMIDRTSGKILLIDFGIASREVRPMNTTNYLKPAAEAVSVDFYSGTPAYQSPEQWNGKRPEPASDQYSLAVTAYRCLAGYMPFESSGNNGLELRSMVLNKRVPPIGWLSAKANAVLAKGMSKRPENRYESCMAFVEALQVAIDAPDVLPRRILKALGVAAVLLLVVVGLLYGGYKISEHRHEKSEADVSHSVKSQMTEEQKKEINEVLRKVDAAIENGENLLRELDGGNGKLLNATKPDVQQKAAAEAQWETEVPQKETVWKNKDKVLSFDGFRMTLKPIPPGTFQMGSSYGFSFETPPHSVTLTKGYWLGETEVTQGQWKAVMGKTLKDQARAHQGKDKMIIGIEADDYPIYYVNFYDAVAFCEKLNSLCSKVIPEGYRLTLPTEAQWERACRADTDTELYSGPMDMQLNWLYTPPALDDIAWFVENSSVGYPTKGGAWNPSKWAEKQFDGTRAGPRQVGGRRKNDYGLYDMIGNMAEWCLDQCKWGKDEMTDTYREGIVDPLCRFGSERMVRGGSWSSQAEFCRSTCRIGCYAPKEGNSSIGFRVALSPATVP